MYAYIHFKLKVPSNNLIDILPISRMLENYYVGHEMDNRVYLDNVKKYVLDRMI